MNHLIPVSLDKAYYVIDARKRCIHEVNSALYFEIIRLADTEEANNPSAAALSLLGEGL